VSRRLYAIAVCAAAGVAAGGWSLAEGEGWIQAAVAAGYATSLVGLGWYATAWYAINADKAAIDAQEQANLARVYLSRAHEIADGVDVDGARGDYGPDDCEELRATRAVGAIRELLAGPLSDEAVADCDPDVEVIDEPAGVSR
jgi:hypothetical protein